MLLVDGVLGRPRFVCIFNNVCIIAFIKAKPDISFQKSNGSWDKIFTNRLKKTDE